MPRFMSYIPRNCGAPHPRTCSRSELEQDPEASAILGTAIQIGKHRGVTTIPLFVSAPNAAAIIVDMAATLGADFLMVGATHQAR